jgi:hypothetical protein
MPRRTIRLTSDTDERLRSTAKLQGYANPSAFLRAAIDHELSGRHDATTGAEERLAVSTKQISREILRLGRAQHALFALVDSLAKILLTCVPEPGGRQWKPLSRGREAGTLGCSRLRARLWSANRSWQCRSW